jgi:hypothetical protein
VAYNRVVQPRERGGSMEDQRHGRFFAQELSLDQAANRREQIQDALDAGERHEWDLLGVSDAPADESVILFWDTSRPSFGRTSRR